MLERLQCLVRTAPDDEHERASVSSHLKLYTAESDLVVEDKVSQSDTHTAYALYYLELLLKPFAESVWYSTL